MIKAINLKPSYLLISCFVLVVILCTNLRAGEPQLPEQTVDSKAMGLVWFDREKLDAGALEASVQAVLTQKDWEKSKLKTLYDLFKHTMVGRDPAVKGMGLILKKADDKGNWPMPQLVVHKEKLAVDKVMLEKLQVLFGDQKLGMTIEGDRWQIVQPEGAAHNGKVDKVQKQIMRTLWRQYENEALRVVLVPDVYVRKALAKQVATLTAKDTKTFIRLRFYQIMSKALFVHGQFNFGKTPSLNFNIEFANAEDAAVFTKDFAEHCKKNYTSLLVQGEKASELKASAILLQAMMGERKEETVQVNFGVRELKALAEVELGLPSLLSDVGTVTIDFKPRVAAATIAKEASTDDEVSSDAELKNEAGLRVRQLTATIIQYARLRQGEFPERFSDLKLILDDAIENMLYNPRTKQNPGFIYVAPKVKLEALKNRSTTAIIYEKLPNGERDPYGFVGYADGQVKQKKKAKTKE